GRRAAARQRCRQAHHGAGDRGGRRGQRRAWRMIGEAPAAPIHRLGMNPEARTPLKFALDIPFVEPLGMRLWRLEGGFDEVSLDVQPSMLNSWQVAHGGVVMTLLDVAMAHAARSVREGDPNGAPRLATIEMKTSFMRAAEGRLLATGTLLHGTQKIA